MYTGSWENGGVHIVPLPAQVAGENHSLHKEPEKVQVFG